MDQYISKSAIVAEIKKRIKGLKDCHADTVAGYAGEISGLERLLSFIDTLEVKVAPQEQWKPSSAQIQALKEACDKHCEPDGLDPLYTLIRKNKLNILTIYKQLKKSYDTRRKSKSL